ncbi:MAG: hypothetical protein MJE68_20090, partial [Proteobacteria bacterium]|nr:hypothetical protein [Pseudomonadota bacterium]
MSNYRSKNDIYLKKHKVISQKNSGFNQNYTKITSTLSDTEIDITGDGSDISGEKSSVDELTDIDGFDHLPEGSNASEWESYDDITPEINKYRDDALEKLRNSNLLDELTQLLSDSGQLKDFMDLLEHLRRKRIPCTNIVFVLLLERARFQSCHNTVGMRYCELTKKFWSIVYRLCKGVGLRFFSGEKNWGQ